MRKLLALVLVVALLIGGWWYVAPWLAMKGLADAAETRDLDSLEARIDFEALRENAHGQVDGLVEARRGDVLGAIAEVVVDNVGGAVIDTALTPRGVATLIESGAFVVGILPRRLRGQEITWDVKREGLNSFRGVGTFEDGTAGPVLIFERDGIGWKMTSFELPSWR